jgi:hypothetical protein
MEQNLMVLAILILIALFAIPGVIAWYGWIVPFMECKARSKPDTCYVGAPCGTCRACEHEIDQEYTIPTMRDLPALADLQTKNIRIGKAI